MKRIDIKKTGLAITAIIAICISLNSIFAQTLDEHNTFLTKGHFGWIDEVLAKGRGGGSISYDLYILEDPNVYRIGANEYDCFDVKLFKHDIKQGDPIEFYLSEPSFRISSIVNLTANNKTYFSFECANKIITEERFLIPFICLTLTLLFGWLTYKKEIKAWLATD